MLVDAPRVGAGLQDHPICLPEWRTPGTRNLWEQVGPEAMDLWQREGRGPMASAGAEAGGFARSRPGLAAPDLQFGLLPGPAPGQDLAPPDRRAVAAIVFAITPASRGRVALHSADPHDWPLIDPAYLAQEADLELLAAGVRQAREIAACRPLAYWQESPRPESRSTATRCGHGSAAISERRFTRREAAPWAATPRRSATPNCGSAA